MWQRPDTHLWQIAFWAVWLICTVLFLLPADELPDIDLWDKAEHALVFCVLMLLALPAHAHQCSARWLSVFLVGYGVLVEVLQPVVADRSFSVNDMLADAVGVGIALLVNQPLQLHRPPQTRPES